VRTYRFQGALTDASDAIDDASSANLARLRRLGQRILAEQSEAVRALIAALGAPKASLAELGYPGPNPSRLPASV
jgi:hypothetical protein